MEKIKALEEFKSILMNENTCLQEFLDREQEVKSAMLDKDWPRLERALGELETKGNTLGELEDRRQDVWNFIVSDGNWNTHGSFYEIMAHFPEEWRQQLGGLYREVKVNTLKLKGLTEGIEAYVRATSNIIKEGLGPYGGKGGTYDNRGAIKPAQGPVVLDKSL